MVTTWNTENLGGTGSATKVILLPIAAGPSVNWGDGTVDNLNTHTYASGGVKTVTIYGLISDWSFNNLGDKLKITGVSQVGGWTPVSSGFYGCSNMEWTATDAPKGGTTFGNLFRGCVLFNGDIGNWITTEISSMISTFRDCPAFNQDIGSWDTQNVLSAASMFNNADAFNQDIGSWDVSSVTSMGSMLRAAAFNQDLSSWNIAACTTFANFLRDSAFSTTNYDLLLPAWEAQSVQDNVAAHFGTATYGAGTPATARAALIADHTWTIIDGGPT